MYLDCQIQLSKDHVEALWERSKFLDFGFGGAGSFMSDFEKSRLVYRYSVDEIFPGQTLAQVTLVGLRPSQQIVAHRDAPIDPAVRYHIPLISNLGCWVLHAGSWQQLTLGHVYSMTPTDWHGAVNWGETLRVHLMIDLLDANPRAA